MVKSHMKAIPESHKRTLEENEAERRPCESGKKRTEEGKELEVAVDNGEIKQRVD